MSPTFFRYFLTLLLGMLLMSIADLCLIRADVLECVQASGCTVLKVTDQGTHECRVPQGFTIDTAGGWIPKPPALGWRKVNQPLPDYERALCGLLPLPSAW